MTDTMTPDPKETIYQPHILRMVSLALSEALPFVGEATRQQVYDACRMIESHDSLDAEQSRTALAALIVAEDDLHRPGKPVDHQKSHQGLGRALQATGRRLIEKEHLRGWIPYDLWLVAQDETSFWTIPEQYQPHIVAIHGVYLFDRNARTYACTTFPAYWLEPVCDRVTFVDQDEMEEAMVEEIEDWARGCDSEGIYLNADTLERVIERQEPGAIHHYGNPQADLVEMREVVEDALRTDLRHRHKLLPEAVQKRMAEFDEAWFEEQVTSQVFQIALADLAGNNPLL